MINFFDNRTLKLQADLVNFGLNPSEWSLHRIQSLSYLIKNNSDDNFTFYGELEYRKQKPKWKLIKIYSI